MLTVKQQLENINSIDSNLKTEDIFILSNARVPILMVKLNNGTTMDIQFPATDYHSIRNTNLIRHYAAVNLTFYVFLISILGRYSISSIILMVKNVVCPFGCQK